jgi:hypothetical protein
MQKPAPYTPIAAPRPIAPPVYRPQPAVSQGKLTAAGAAARLAPGPAIAPAPPVYRPAAAVASVQPRMAPVQSAVVQLRPCIECKHDHGSKKCKLCGCTSHSSKWKKGAKFNPKGNKHKRILAAAQKTT